MKYAIFDVDWTLIKPLEGRTFPKNKLDWQWLYESVPETLQTYAEDYHIVFVTDQTKDWKVEMIDDIVEELGIDVTLVISRNKVSNKPCKDLFLEAVDKYSKKSSFYVGDAGGDVSDWSDVDINFAKNIGVMYYRPENIFPDNDGENEYDIDIPDYKEAIIMVGYPGSGKSTLATQFPNYQIISGDIFKTPEKMIKEATKYVGKQSIIFDATNGTIEKRAKFIKFANAHNIMSRIIWLQTDIDTCISNISKRVSNGGNHVPKIALYTYRKRFEEPTCDECDTVVKLE